MFRLRSSIALSCVLSTAAAALAADFSNQETTQVTGGSMLQMMKMAGAFSSQARKAGEPISTTVYLQENRKATVAQDSIEIIDLDKEAVTHVDLLKHTWYTLTFAEMRARMEAARAKAEKAEKKQAPAPQDSSNANNNVQASFDVKVRNTGAHKAVSGLDTSESIMTMTMTATDTSTQQSGAIGITNDMWMTPEVAGYDQLRDFDRRYAEKMASVMGIGAGQDFTGMLMAHPGATEAMGKMAVEMQKLHGIPVMQITRMGPTADGKPIPAASEAPLPPPAPSPSGGDLAKQAFANSLPFGFGHKKKDQDQNAGSNGAQPAGAQSGVAAILMETQITSSNFSSAHIDGSHFEVPAGMKEITAPDGRF
ncbi:MAG: hypothetical protein WB679_09425 [Terracidiphilus sp.]